MEYGKRSKLRARYAGWPILWPASIVACLASNGCTVKGFQTVPDGPSTPSQLRAGAAVARAEAEALDKIADMQEGVIREIVGKVQAAAEGLGAPAIVTGLIAGGSGLLLPSPGQRRREKVAAAEAKAGAAKA